MELTPFQTDAIIELINIAFSRTAASLSELTNNRVDLDVPQIELRPIAELTDALAQFVHGDVATVHQIFHGTVGGDALLVLDHAGALKLVSLLTGDAEENTGRLGASSKEVLSEVGNILLNACLGVFGDLLSIRVGFTVPRLSVDDLATFVGSIVVGKDELQYALLVGARFQIRASEVRGCLVLVLGISSLNLLTDAVENWARAALGEERA